MAPPIGSRNNPFGRPRDLSRELSRLEEAAGHAQAILEQRHLVALMTDHPGHRAVIEQDIAADVAQLVEIQALVERIRGIHAMAEPTPSRAARRRRRNRKRALGADPYEAWIADATIRLDRMASDLGLPQ